VGVAGFLRGFISFLLEFFGYYRGFLGIGKTAHTSKLVISLLKILLIEIRFKTKQGLDKLSAP
jgi:hypothetical protein